MSNRLAAGGRPPVPSFGTILGVVLSLAAASCPGAGAVASQLEYPIAIRALAPAFPERTSIERLPDDADKERLIDAHRLFRAEHQEIFRALRTPSWWLITPRAQPTGGYRLRVRFSGQTARACLEPPQGPVTLAFETPSYFVALPRRIERVDWRDTCAPSEMSPASCLRFFEKLIGSLSKPKSGPKSE